MSQLRVEWYGKLRSSGFVDIENWAHPDEPLIEHHSFVYVSERAQARKAIRSIYQLQIDSFANDPSFPEVLKLMVKHGNNRFSVREIEEIWDLHRTGQTERGIASQMKRTKSAVHFLLVRMREWMNLL